jgi:hypothetical protein
MTKEPSAYEISQLTALQRNMLINHIDGTVDVTLHDHNLVQVRGSLLRNGMIKGATPFRPRATMLTERGRYALAAVLAHYAEALVRAGVLEARPIDILAQIKRRPPTVSPEMAEKALLPAMLAVEAFRK